MKYNIWKFVAVILLLIVVGISIPRGINNTKEYSEFTTPAELGLWLLIDDTDTKEYINKSFDCDDFAMNLVDNARECGYKIYLRTDDINHHVLCLTKICGMWYLIEPQSDIVTFYCREL